jgi:hypothetical protein
VGSLCESEPPGIGKRGFNGHIGALPEVSMEILIVTYSTDGGTGFIGKLRDATIEELD